MRVSVEARPKRSSTKAAADTRISRGAGALCLSLSGTKPCICLLVAAL